MGICQAGRKNGPNPPHRHNLRESRAMRLIPKFLLSATSPDHFPPPSAPEVAFLGRSNVGKSSLLNALVGSKQAHVSSTPGRTQAINFFALLDTAASTQPALVLGRSAGLWLRQDIEVHLGRVAEVHRAVPRTADYARALRLPGGQQNPASGKRSEAHPLLEGNRAPFCGCCYKGGPPFRERAHTDPLPLSSEHSGPRSCCSARQRPSWA